VAQNHALRLHQQFLCQAFALIVYFGYTLVYAFGRYKLTMKNMKTKKIKSNKTSRFLPAIIVIVVAAAGVAALVSSKAATPSTVHATVYTANDVVASPGISVGGSIIPTNYIGANTVATVSSGSKLVYNNGSKGNVTHCYYVSVMPDKGGNGSATVYFASNNKILTKTITYDSTRPNDLQQVCVGAGRDANPGYNIYNVSPLSSTNSNLVVYEDIVTW
jgi:hypothetical protein